MGHVWQVSAARRQVMGTWAVGVAVLVSSIAGCARKEDVGSGGRGVPVESPYEQARPTTATVSGAADEMAAARSRAAPAVQALPDQGVPVPTSRKVIRNGTMRLEVPGLDGALDRLRVLLTAAGGHIASESRSQDEGQGRQATVTCRMPAERLDDLIARLREVGHEEAIELAADDITEQYFDLEVRLRTQQQLELRLRQLLERTSHNLSDLLQIEREAARVRGEIDQMEGRKRLWDQQVALSTLTVHLHEPRPMAGGDEGGVWRTLRRAFRESADNFVEAVAGVIAATGAIIPVAAALALAGWIVRAIWRLARRRRTVVP